jgi:selenocysteine lyase/cysteine desulfurase
MPLNRREFLAGTAAVLASTPKALQSSERPAADTDFATLRKDFPWIENQTYINNAGVHPVSAPAARVVEEHLAYKVRGPGADRLFIGEPEIEELKELYGRIINAKSNEIALVQSTLDGENVVAAGLGLHRGGGNVVTDEFHYHGGAYIYKQLQDAGLEVRIVKQRDWRTHLNDFEELVDDNTRLIAITLVSNINGFVADSKKLSELAHAHGAYVYADVVQAAGCVPMDVRALGLDFCCAGGYKWLMGLDGLGFLYVKEELQDDVLHPMQFGDRQYDDIQYHNFPGSPTGDADLTWKPKPGAARYEIGTLPFIVIASQLQSLQYILDIGVDRIQAHATPMIERLLREMPALGYPSITPEGMQTPLAAFQAPNPEDLSAKLKRANVDIKVKWNQTRISPSVYNNDDDIDALLNALS